MSNLYLFDIDGTLVDLLDQHVAAYQESYRAIVDRDVDRDKLVGRFGLGETAMHEQIFRQLGIENQEKIPEVIRCYEERLYQLLQGHTIKVLPGVNDFLQLLQQRSEQLGIISGNMEEKGKFILKQAGLLHYFAVFGFSDGMKSRTEIVRRAMAEAQPHKRVVVIGDTPYDIAAGKDAEAFTVAVTTGQWDREALQGADLVLENLLQYPLILAAVS